MGVYPEPVGISLGAARWEWHDDVGLHILELYCADVLAEDHHRPDG